MPRPEAPSKVVCFARTFRKHALELGNPVPTEPIFFIKPSTAIIGTGAPVYLPPESSLVQHEAEVAAVLGARLRRASSSQAAQAIAAWTVLNDVTARDLQRAEGGRFSRAKGFDTFCPIAPERLDHLDWRAARIQCLVNGQMRQDGALSDLLFEPAELVAWASQTMTLLPGDIVSLGTPEGVGELRAGDQLVTRLVDADGCVLVACQNPIANEPEASA